MQVYMSYSKRKSNIIIIAKTEMRVFGLFSFSDFLQITSHPNFGELNTSQDATEFVSRHGSDGTFTFVDLRVSGVLGYQPQVSVGGFFLFKSKQFFVRVLLQFSSFR